VTLNTPNATTISAMKEAERLARDPHAKRYSDVEEALKELKR
jgi:DNA-damage-inducible protein J